MKYFVSLLILVLFLTVPWNTAVSKMHPDTYKDLLRPDGDDHPWGGEEVTNPDDFLKSIDEPAIPIYTGYLILDFAFNKLFRPVILQIRNDVINTPSQEKQITVNTYSPNRDYQPVSTSGTYEGKGN